MRPGEIRELAVLLVDDLELVIGLEQAVEQSEGQLDAARSELAHAREQMLARREALRVNAPALFAGLVPELLGEVDDERERTYAGDPV